MKLRIGISYIDSTEPRYANYTEALRKASQAIEVELEIVDLYQHPDSISEIDGILFTGGPDIAPARYGKQDELSYCPDVNEQRDTIEWELAARSEEQKLPTLGICRGSQLLNVVFGGTLVTDLEHFGAANHKRINDVDQRHPVHVETGSLLRTLVRKSDGEINSAHHQGVERVGEGLVVTARAEDGTVEALEQADQTDRPFWLAVQWHPERLGYDEAFAHPIFESFLLEALGWKLLKSRIDRPQKSLA